MTETITNAVAVRDNGPQAMVERYQGELAQVMPSHVNAQAWTRLAVGVLRRDPKVAEAAGNDVGAFMSALMDAAQKGLTPGTDEFYLVPRRKRRGAPLTIQGNTGYQGYIELMYRAGAVSSVIVEAVYTNDRFQYRPGRDERPDHEIDWDADDRGQLRLVYAYAIMRDGATSKVVVLNRKKIQEIRAKSDSAHSEYSPWNTNEESMWLKSAARQLRKWVPTSAEYIREQLRAKAEVDAEQTAPQQLATPSAPMPQPHQDDDEDGPVEGELVD
ncbi:recombinase RecT [Streptomyces violascens]|uniref:recombinase RecT n=1 Tax=Streptomyces violascens TaxID=67381 RepID=UPI00368B6F4F